MRIEAFNDVADLDAQRGASSELTDCIGTQFGDLVLVSDHVTNDPRATGRQNPFNLFGIAASLVGRQVMETPSVNNKDTRLVGQRTTMSRFLVTRKSSCRTVFV